MNTPTETHLSAYTPPPFLIEHTDLTFDLAAEATTVVSTLKLRRNPKAVDPKAPLILDGQELELVAIALDGQPLDASAYTVDDDHLTLPDAPDAFVLSITVRIHPERNTALEGLYASSGNLATQCEAEGFRKIPYYLDRPDVLAPFTVRLESEISRYPVLLSNGNPGETGDLPSGRHFAVWNDPFPKPCYLFALVAGDLVTLSDSFTTMSGRQVGLRIHVQTHNTDQCDHAMASIKKSMAWDEKVYGREYDLEVYQIVAVDDFNMGAMENKGLNIFNSKYVLARPDTATDTDFEGIEGVIGHEYFHNWSGNRVTCRDWFQLSLKEGFTVFRDQEFTSDVTSRPVKRIEDVARLRTFQFAEDGGPMAHPVRPESYIEINNFYTLTVYEKGAEVVRMIHTLLGPALFREGCDLYFARHDGQAATVEDFVAAMSAVSGRDFTPFWSWYRQAGTPVVTVTSAFDPSLGVCTLTLTQSCPPSPGQPEKGPYLIPFKIGALGRAGHPLALRLRGAHTAAENHLIELTQPVTEVVFEGLNEEPVWSLNRGFSAPIKVEAALDEAALALLAGSDPDSVNRWDAMQQLATRQIMGLIPSFQGRSETPPQVSAGLIEAFARTLADESLDPALAAAALTLPAEGYLAEQIPYGTTVPVVDPVAIFEARQFVRRSLAQKLEEHWQAAYERTLSTDPYRFTPEQTGKRRLKNLALATLLSLPDPKHQTMGWWQFEDASNMTDQLAALTALVHNDAPQAAAALEQFYAQWRGEALVLDKWFAIQATAPTPGALDRVKGLMDHPDFSMRNPNRMRALIASFASGNPSRFHEASGAGYAFLAERILDLNETNPQVASRLLTPLTRWRRFDVERQGLMKGALERIAAHPNLSKDVFEVVSKSLKG